MDSIFRLQVSRIFDEDFVKDELVAVVPGFYFFIIGAVLQILEWFAGFVVVDDDFFVLFVVAHLVDFSRELGIFDHNALASEVVFGLVVGAEVILSFAVVGA